MARARVEILADLRDRYADLAQVRRTNKLATYAPYPKQLEFHAAGQTYRERLLSAGNQLGKTLAGSMEIAMHLTGKYPEWWPGRRWDKPIRTWAAGITGESTRDTVQTLLLGPPGELGTGSIPKSSIIEVSSARGLAGSIDTVLIKHASGGRSMIQLKSYEKGREKWQGPTLDAVWFDEEPPEDIYSEGLTRTNATGGFAFMTFTPLLGMSAVARKFFQEQSPDRHLTQMTIEDAYHYTPERRAQVIASYPEHEREARAMGVPMMGSGRIFPIAESEILVDPIPIPKHWPRIVGLDFGWEHPTAAVWLAWDREADVIYITDCYREKQQVPTIHAAAIKARGDWIPVAWPHDGLQTEKGTGVTIKERYIDAGLKMLSECASHEDGGRSVEAGLLDMYERMMLKQFRVFKHLALWREEFRMYHRVEGKITKEFDDLMDATRYAYMMLRYAKVQTIIPDRYSRRRAQNEGSWMSL